MTIGIGLLGLGTVGAGVAEILQTPDGRHPLVGELALKRVAVRDLNRPRPIDLPSDILCTDPEAVVQDPAVDIVVEVMGGLEPARSLILAAIAAGKPVVTANKAVIARHGEEIAAAAAEQGVYVLIEAAVGGGIPIIEPLKQSLGGNRIQRVSGIINGTTNYILSRMADEGAAYAEVLADAQRLGYAEADPAADVGGGDAADKIAILSGLAYGGPIERAAIPTEGIDRLDGCDVTYAEQLGYVVKLVAQAQNLGTASDGTVQLDVRVSPTLLPKDHPLAGVHGVNNAILVEGDPVGRVMFYGPGAGSGPTASAVVADILNIAGIRAATGNSGGLDPLLAASRWRNCALVDAGETLQRHYVRLQTGDEAGVIGRIGSCFGEQGVSIRSIVQFETTGDAADAEIVVITHEVKQQHFAAALAAIKALPEVKAVAACLPTL
ncbi:MAG: homoserine dehydrogenase [Cyanobacteria bacterium]|jgi:homoserine dehydrogenase|uniref:homoserine dehydrogenase n=1 Tax=unclassified Vulcanococcus TaxID=2766969 RepID=UPI002600E30B|nr:MULTISPECIES: homoserine dehydrogenase [unclassified Vulcanococcus]MDA0726961.1 homoserine dehydrogenase [Cyanobacteriota bacterium]MDA0963756.1 homoserine dehydrogenase [Cyanobacteriota bacterium]MDA1156801.1 homoserine dehydrogenase [Cyanobacteriota bacterium]NCV92851.1 homoserine dehydrogenase [Synechococcaceae bacterium WB7_3xG_012]